MPTERCNYRCPFCYESFEKGRMSDADAEALGKAIERIVPSARQFALAFFGGEPLLCADLALRLSRLAFALCSERGMSYGASIATNGHYLSAERFEELADAGVVAFQVTLDVDRELHDRQRRTVKGDPTFDRTVAQLRAMAASSARFACTIRCNTHPADRERVLSLFDGDLSGLRGDPRFTVDPHTIWASDGHDLLEAPDADAASSGAEGYGARVARSIDQHFLNRELEERGLPTSAYGRGLWRLTEGCYAGKPNWFVVGSDLTLGGDDVPNDRCPAPSPRPRPKPRPKPNSHDDQ
jgi:uncharacterized protein